MVAMGPEGLTREYCMHQYTTCHAEAMNTTVWSGRGHQSAVTGGGRREGESGRLFFWILGSRNKTGRRSFPKNLSAMPASRFMFTSESVNEGHPDKLADQVRVRLSPP
jgi:hypothetical protein